MPSIPLPFIVALMLAILLVRMLGRQDGRAADQTLAAVLAACTLQAIVVGLRWSHGLEAARLAQPVLAAALPPIAWIGFSRLHALGETGRRREWLHLLPAVGVAGLVGAWPAPIDLVLLLLFLGYGTALLVDAGPAEGELGYIRIGDEPKVRRARMVVGMLLIGSGLLDVVVAVLMELGRGSHAEAVVALGNLVTLAVAGLAVAFTDRAKPTSEPLALPGTGGDEPPADRHRGPEEEKGTDADRDALALFETLMREKKLYRDPDLTLARLARRALMPARQISRAVNRTHGRSISQLVNEYRVHDAEKLLAETDDSVTTIQLAVGFSTKSNFNREFSRVTGTSPSEYRRSRLPVPAPSVPVDGHHARPSRSG